MSAISIPETFNESASVSGFPHGDGHVHQFNEQYPGTGQGFTGAPLRVKKANIVNVPKTPTNEMDELKLMLNTVIQKVNLLEVNKPQTMSPQPVAKGLHTELSPDDSSSTMGRYREQRKFWKPDYNDPSTFAASQEEEDIETILNVGPVVDRNENVVVRGFVKTNPIAFHEQKMVSKIKTIPGLQQVFICERLNFLAHLHSALHSLSHSEDYPPPDFVSRLEKTLHRSARNPQTELLKMVISTTIDFENMVVCSNAFRIPVLEVGMRLTEQYIYMAFHQLNSEYESTWFEAVKNMRIPSFHGRFVGKSDSYLSNVHEFGRKAGSMFSVQSKSSKGSHRRTGERV